ncbi:MAG: sel1 repeat family protein [Sandaracinaceae bacterium]|nr:sel1 repeat family protein [Sandaracinaceae bacterium]
MRTDHSRRALWASVVPAIAAVGCGGGGGGGEGGGGSGTSGGEEPPIVCSVPGSPAMDDYAAGVRAARSGDATSMATLERACEAGNACACSSVGSLLEGGELVPRDVDRAITMLERGCQGADALGCYALGAALFEHREDQAERVAELYATACDDDVADACQALGRLRMSGIGGAEDQAEAVRRYESACEDGNVFACYFLGQAAARGLGMEADPVRARELLAWSCEQAQLPHACTALAELDTERRAGLLATACEGGDPMACVALEPPAPGDGTAASALALAGADTEAREIQTNDASFGGAPVGGDVDLSSLGLPRSCVGFVGREPSRVLRVPTGVDRLRLTALSDTDSVVAVRDASGRWSCADDDPGGSFHASVTLESPAPGMIAVWAGTLRPGRLSSSGSLHYESEGVEPPNPDFATPAGPQAVTIPASSRARFYQLRVINAAGVGGTIRLDGHDVWPFGPDGGQILSGENVQCALGAGAHSLEVNVTSRTRTAHGDGDPLVAVELHATAAAGGEVSDATRLFQIRWSPPEAPAQRTTTFRLSRTQAADRAQCAAPPAGG